MFNFCRGYNKTKIQNNIECEIFQTILEEAKASYKEKIIHEVKGETEEDLESTLKSVQTFLDQWSG